MGGILEAPIIAVYAFAVYRLLPGGAADVPQPDHDKGRATVVAIIEKDLRN